MDSIALAAAVTIMGAIVASMMALYQSTASPRNTLERRLGTLLNPGGGFQAAVLDFAALRPTRTGKVPFVSGMLEGRSWTEGMALKLERADIKLTVSEYVSVRILVGLFAALAVMLFLPVGGPVRLAAMGGAGFAGTLLPNFYVNFAQGRRIKKLEAQLVDALSLVSNSLKAGFGLMQALDLAARELSHPISTELRRLLNDINVGATTEDALLAFARRSGSEDLDIVITAMLVQQSTGGNLAEVLDNVAHTMRERIRIRGEIKTLTTTQLLTGFVVGGLPFVVGAFFLLTNADYMMPLFTTLPGNAMLVAAGTLELFGILTIKKILAIEV